MQVDFSVDLGVSLADRLVVAQLRGIWLVPSISFVDPFHFYLDPDIAEMLRETKIKNLRPKTIFFLLFMRLLFMYIKQKRDLLLKILWYSYNFGRFFMCYPDP